MQDIAIKNNDSHIILRKSLLSLFQGRAGKEMEALNCHYFAHNFHKNYNKQDYTVSAFCSHPEWQHEYWQNYWNSDKLSIKVHGTAAKDGLALTTWDFVDPDSDLMKRRKSVCHLDDGIYFTFRHDDGLLENYSFGWKKSEKGQIDAEKLSKLFDVMNDFRNTHLKLFYESNP